MSTNAVATVNEQDTKRNQALLKAVGLDRVPPEQRELAMAIADRYGLDLLLKHIVLIDGRPYITRDGLLHIAHRSGVFDGMEVTDPTIVDIGTGKFWSARCSVYRRDMGRPFTYAGRYPTTGGNQKFAPEMATKVAEVMALRRAFDVSAPVLEERWDLDTTPAPDPTPAPSLDERIAQRAQRVTTSAPTAVPAGEGAAEPVAATTDGVAAGSADIVDGEAVEVPPQPVQCPSTSDPAMGDVEQCRREAGHRGSHKTPDQSWPQ